MNTENRTIFIDSSLFMGMHSSDEKTRHQSLSIMSSQFSNSIYMNLEQVGMCDECVWRYSRKIQDDYYPFMDVLHTEMNINRIGYCKQDIERVNKDERILNSDLSVQSALSIAQIINRDAVLYTHDKHILSLDFFSKHVGIFPTKEQTGKYSSENNSLKNNYRFSPDLDRLYDTSRSLVFSF